MTEHATRMKFGWCTFDQMSSSAHSKADASCRVMGWPAPSAVSRAISLYGVMNARIMTAA
jgi:hypothetical protein